VLAPIALELLKIVILSEKGEGRKEKGKARKAQTPKM
jgi:hypothetical protein